MHRHQNFSSSGKSKPSRWQSSICRPDQVTSEDAKFGFQTSNAACERYHRSAEVAWQNIGMPVAKPILREAEHHISVAAWGEVMPSNVKCPGKGYLTGPFPPPCIQITVWFGQLLRRNPQK